MGKFQYRKDEIYVQNTIKKIEKKSVRYHCLRMKRAASFGDTTSPKSPMQAILASYMGGEQSGQKCGELEPHDVHRAERYRKHEWEIKK